MFPRGPEIFQLSSPLGFCGPCPSSHPHSQEPEALWCESWWKEMPPRVGRRGQSLKPLPSHPPGRFVLHSSPGDGKQMVLAWGGEGEAEEGMKLQKSSPQPAPWERRGKARTRESRWEMGLCPQNRRGRRVGASLFCLQGSNAGAPLHSHRGPGREEQDSKEMGKRRETWGGVAINTRVLEQGLPVTLARAGLPQLCLSVIHFLPRTPTTPWPWPADASRPSPVPCAGHIFSDGSIVACKDSTMPTR